MNAIKEEINKVVKIQEEFDIDVLVHGEPEVNLAICFSLIDLERKQANCFFSYHDLLIFLCSETTWLNTSASSCLVLPSLSTAGCNLMAPDASNPPSSMAM